MKNNLISFYVQEYFLNYLPNIRNCSINTIKTYRYAFIDLIQFFDELNININDMLMSDFKVEYIEKYIQFLKNKNNSNSTINTKIISLKSFFNFLNYKTIDYINICTQINQIKLLKKDFVIPEYLLKDEIFFLLDMSEESISLKEKVVFILLYYGALRVNELCNLKKEDIEILDKKSIRIKIYNSKNNKSRIINFECFYSDYIIKYINQVTNNNESFLFINKYGNKYTKKGINYIINKIYDNGKKINEDATLFTNEKIHPHMLRHSRAMAMLKDGVSLSEIKEYLGHSCISTTEIYARLDTNIIEESLKRHAKKINNPVKYSKKEKMDLENWLKSI